VREVIEWDMAPMRKFFHGVQIPAFCQKYTDGGYHPEEERHDFTPDEVKTFLKAKFLGFERDAAWDRWAKVLKLDQPVLDIYQFTKRWSRNLSVDTPVGVRSSESVEPVEYWEMISQGNKYYFDTFGECYDIREMPERPNEM
jgi:hypothetical protein